MTTGDLIREARKKAGFTQKQLGELCGIAEPTIRRYELNKLNPKRETLQKIAKPLGVHWYELVTDSEDEQVEAILDEIEEAVNHSPVDNEYVQAFFNSSIQQAALALRPDRVYKNQKAKERAEKVAIATYLSFFGINPPDLESLISVGFDPNEAFLIMDVLTASVDEKNAIIADMKQKGRILED